MAEVAMTSSAHSPNTVLERYSISRENPVIDFELGSNVVLHMSSHDDDNGRERDSSNVHTKAIMDYRGGDIRNLRGHILSTNDEIIGFRTVNESVGESVNIINVLTKQRHRFKELGDRNAIDIAFAQHNKYFAIIDTESSLFIYKVNDGCEVQKYVSVLNWPSRSTRDESERYRISWCPYVPVYDESEEDCDMLSVYSGRHVHILNIGALVRADQGDEFDFEAAKNIEGAVMSLTIEEEDEDQDVQVTCVCISPDSTAAAIAKSTGIVSFYLINEEENVLKFSHNFHFDCFGKNTSISDLIFLDDFTTDRKEIPLWRSFVAMTNGGRKLAIFDCKSYRCLGRIRFESPLDVNDFVPIVDPSALFIHLLDVEGMNLFSIELTPCDDKDDLPRFVGVTQTSFFHSIYAIAHINKGTTENADESSDLFSCGYDEDDSDDESPIEGDIVRKPKKIKTKRQFVAMGKRRMVELEVTLKMRAQQPKEHMSVLSVENEDQGIAEPTENNYKNDMMFWKLDEIVRRIDKMEAERQTSNSLILEMISNIDQEMRQRERSIISRVEEICDTARHETIAEVRSDLSAVQATFDRNLRSLNLDSEYLSQRIGGSVRVGLQECVVPAFERLCENLFARLNEHFRLGLNEYMGSTTRMVQDAVQTAFGEQRIQSQQAMSSQQIRQPIGTPAQVDRQSLTQLLATAPELAFEAALNNGDRHLLEFVCAAVDPDVLIPKNILPQPVLISLLQQLTLNLNEERDLKYRYIEQILPAIKLNDPGNAQVLPDVVRQLLANLQKMMDSTSDQQVKRHTKLLIHFARSTVHLPPGHPLQILHLHGSTQPSPL